MSKRPLNRRDEVLLRMLKTPSQPRTGAKVKPTPSRPKAATRKADTPA